MTTIELEQRLTQVAADAFENGSLFVYGREGVLWLAARVGEKYRTMRAVGIPKQGIPRLTAEVRRIASEH